MKIRWRLALYGTAVAAIGMIIFAVSLVSLIRQTAPNDQILLLGQIADETVAAIGAIPDFPPDEPLTMPDLTTSSEPFVQVLAADGSVLYRTAQLGGSDLAMDFAQLQSAVAGGEAVSVELHGAEYRIQAKSWARPDANGLVVAGQSVEAVDAQLAGLRFVIWAAAFITMLAAAVVSWLVSGRALRPLKQLAMTTDAIGQTGDLSRRLPGVRADDEVGALTASFNAMLDRLEEAQRRTAAALAAQKRFVADASHDLRSPLTTIRNNAGFLSDRPGIAETDRVEAVADILGESERMTRLVDHLLDLARTDLERERPHASVDLSVVARAVARRIEPRHDRPITVAETGPVPLTGDEDGLTRLVEILVENAVLHGGGPIDLEVRTRRDQAQLIVADRGPGLPAADLPRVFDRFFRSDQARTPSGSGLGLSIAESIVTSHGGSISAANRDGGGLVITATLPLA